MAHVWLRSWNTLPQSDELVLVALYQRDGKLQGYELCYFRDGEWQSAEGNYSWSVATGLLWRYFDAAPETRTEIPGSKQVAA